MPSLYLQPDDYEAYGVPAATAAQVSQASTVIDQLLGRPEGLVWMPDADGVPTYMAALSPTMTFALGTDISPGQRVTATLSPAIVTPDMIGDVLVLDREATASCEAVVITATSGRDTVTFETVRYAHVAQSAAEQGLLITEDRSMPSQRNVTRVARIPCAALHSLQGRYGYGRRSDQISGVGQDFNVLAAVQAFGGVPGWTYLNPRDVAISPVTGEVWVPSGFLMAAFSDVRLRYVAGYPAAGLPAPIKQAVANILASLAATADLPGQIRMYRAGDTTIQRFGASNVDPDTRAMLSPFKVRAFF